MNQLEKQSKDQLMKLLFVPNFEAIVFCAFCEVEIASAYPHSSSLFNILNYQKLIDDLQQFVMLMCSFILGSLFCKLLYSNRVIISISLSGLLRDTTAPKQTVELQYLLWLHGTQECSLYSAVMLEVEDVLEFKFIA